MSSQAPPIALFAFARPNTTAEVINALRQQTEQADVLYVFVDKPTTTACQRTWQHHEECLALLKGIDFIKTIIVVREENYGCRKNIISGINQVLAEHDTIVVLEDDIVPQPYFYKFIKDCLERYKDSPDVFSISAYAGLHESEIKAFAPQFYQKVIDSITTDCFMSNRFLCSGWGTWANRWNNISAMFNDDKDMYANIFNIPKTAMTYDLVHLYREYQVGKSNSWAVPLGVYSIKHNLKHVMAVKSLIRNIGFGVEGATHTVKAKPFVNDTTDPLFLPQKFPTTNNFPALIAQKSSLLFLTQYVLYKLIHKIIYKLSKSKLLSP